MRCRARNACLLLRYLFQCHHGGKSSILVRLMVGSMATAVPRLRETLFLLAVHITSEAKLFVAPFLAALQAEGRLMIGYKT